MPISRTSTPSDTKSQNLMRHTVRSTFARRAAHGHVPASPVQQELPPPLQQEPPLPLQHDADVVVGVVSLIVIAPSAVACHP